MAVIEYQRDPAATARPLLSASREGVRTARPRCLGTARRRARHDGAIGHLLAPEADTASVLDLILGEDPVYRPASLAEMLCRVEALLARADALDFKDGAG